MHSKQVNGYRLTVIAKVVALTLCVGALPFLFSRAYAGEVTTENGETTEGKEAKAKNPWLDDYKKHIGFTYSAEARLQTAYLYRGSYSGGPNIQAEAYVGYGGLYAGCWWNVGVTNWAFDEFQPEVDFLLGFKRWGLDVSLLYVHNFDRALFDLTNYQSGGNSLEVRARYTVSSKLPLSILWGTRVAGADGYLNPETGEMVRAWSSYLELSYTHHFPYDLSLYGGIGITPWKSRFTRFQRDFAFQVIELRLRKDWTVSRLCGLMLQATFLLNPSGIAADPSTVQWHSFDPGRQTINTNLAFGVYLR